MWVSIFEMLLQPLESESDVPSGFFLCVQVLQLLPGNKRSLFCLWLDDILYEPRKCHAQDADIMLDNAAYLTWRLVHTVKWELLNVFLISSPNPKDDT